MAEQTNGKVSSNVVEMMRRENDRRIEHVEKEVTVLRDDVTKIGVEVTVINRDLKSHNQQTRENVNKLHERINGVAEDQAAAREVDANHTKLLGEISTKLDTIHGERMAVKSFPKILGYILAVITGIAGIASYLHITSGG